MYGGRIINQALNAAKSYDIGMSTKFYFMISKIDGFIFAFHKFRIHN
jgi:hypothetical protein